MHESVVSICQRIENRFIFFFWKKVRKLYNIILKKEKRKSEAGHSFVIVQKMLSGKVFFFLVEKERKGKLSHLGVLLCQVRSIAYLSGPILSYTINDIASRYSIYLSRKKKKK